MIVGTIHSVKGGEADVVYVAPDLSERGALEWESTNESRKDRVRRLFYVAITRAREKVVALSSSSAKGVW